MVMSEKPWSVAVEVHEREMRVGNPLCADRYAFYKDLRLRLEQTKPGFALRYEFKDASTARLYANYAADWFRKESINERLRYKVRNHNGRCYLYFRRERTQKR